MKPSETGLQRFLSEHPNLKPDEISCLMYRAGYTDGALDTLTKLEKAFKSREETDV